MKIETITNSPLSTGRKHMLAYAEGKPLGRTAAMTAKCFECCNGYLDGRSDCGIKACPMYPYMPYRDRVGA